jgi:hypothetical protein
MYLARRGWRTVSIVFSVGLMLSMTSCLAKSRIGVLSRTGQEIQLLIVHCSGTDSLRVHKIELVEKPSAIAASDDPARRTLWKVTSSGADVEQVIVGETPSGFAEVKGLTDPPGPDDPLALVVDAGITWDQSFTLRQLEPNRVLYGGRLVALDAFQKEAQSGGGCATQLPGVLLASLMASGVLVVGAILLAERRRRRNLRRSVVTP